MEEDIKSEWKSSAPVAQIPDNSNTPGRGKNKPAVNENQSAAKRRCVSTACIACRRRKSKCNGGLPKCAACASVYLTECEYAPHTDHRRKGVYKKDADGLKTKNAILQVLVQALLSYEEDDAIDLVRQMRSAENLEEIAQAVEAKEKSVDARVTEAPPDTTQEADIPQFDVELSRKMGDLLLDGSVKFIGGTSNLIWLNESSTNATPSPSPAKRVVRPREEAILNWTAVTKDKDVILHFLNMYFCWHYSYFTTLSKELFYRDFLTGTCSQYCSALLVNAMLALGCHFSSRPAARADPDDAGTTGDHYFAEAKRLIYEDDEFANAKLCTVQALALMSVREAGCGRESRGWVYSGMSFRMASDLGLNVDAPAMNDVSRLSDEDIDARQITFWGCFLFDKCWSNYLGRQPQLQQAHSNTRKFEVFPSEDSEMWSPYTDGGMLSTNSQPARTRAVALQISKLAEISSDLLISFYQPLRLENPPNKQVELKKLSDIHTRLESWKRELPSEMEPKEGQLPHVLLMHMFFQLLYIHLYRPFLRYTKSTSPLPAHVSPRKFCSQAASTISKLLRLYKRTHGLRQIINKVVYIAHSACTIHLLNLPEKSAKRDIVHGVKQLEEIGECWIAARRTLQVLYACAEKWKIELPEEATTTFARSKARWGSPEVTAAAVSPDATPNITQRMKSESISRIMDQNLRQEQQYLSSQRQIETFDSMQDSQANISSNIPAHSRDNLQHRSSSGDVSQPPMTGSSRSHAQSTSNSHNARGQKEAWQVQHAHATTSRIPTQRARPTSLLSNNNDSNSDGSLGRAEGFVEESQDWWFNDQNQLAVGFDNWNAPTSEWSNLSGLGFGSYGDLASTAPSTLGSNGFSGGVERNSLGQLAYGEFSPVGQGQHQVSASMTMPTTHSSDQLSLPTQADVFDAGAGLRHSQSELSQTKGQVLWDTDSYY